MGGTSTGVGSSYTMTCGGGSMGGYTQTYRLPPVPMEAQVPPASQDDIVMSSYEGRSFIVK